MLIDITLKITKSMLSESTVNENKALIGHVGTHFDVMDEEFPLSYTKRKGIVFDVSGVTHRDICADDIDIEKVSADMFVAFYSGFIESVGYGESGYFTVHPQLSDELIDALVEKGISIIGLDFAGIRRGKEHIPKDRYCAQHGVFVVENLLNLKRLLNYSSFYVYTYPMSIGDITGLPCRVVAEVDD